MLLRTCDLESTIRLTEGLSTFKNSRFTDASVFSKISLGNLRRWTAVCKPLVQVCGGLEGLEMPMGSIEKPLHDLITHVIEALCASQVATNDDWIIVCMKLLAELVQHPIEYLLNSMKLMMDSDKTYNQESTQKYYRLLRTVCVAIETIMKHELFRQLNVKDHMMKVHDGLRLVLDRLAEIALVRLQNSFKEHLSFSFEALEMVQCDIESMRVIGFLVPLLDSYALSRFNTLFEWLLGQMHWYITNKTAELDAMSNQDKIKFIHEVVRRRLKVLKFLETNQRYLSVCNNLSMGEDSKDYAVFLQELHESNYSISKSSDKRRVLFASPALCQDHELRSLFFESHVKRTDCFSDDFVVAMPVDVFLKANTLEWSKVDCTCHMDLADSPIPENSVVVYSHCFSMLRIFAKNLHIRGLEVTISPSMKRSEQPFVYQHQELFTEFIMDALKVIITLPITQFKVKDVEELWHSAVSFWDLVETFFTNPDTSFMWKNEDAKVELCISSIVLLRFACMNIRLNYLEPFTWAAEILVRFTEFMSRCDRSFRSSFMKSSELAGIYNEFQQKWSQIEGSAIKQWENCVVFRKEITRLQVGAYNLERALWLGSTFLPGVSPLERLSENFLLNFLDPNGGPIFTLAEEKKFKIVSILKRKQWIETFCCYDLEKRTFITVKEVRLVNGSLAVAKDLDIANRYSGLSKLRHPNLAEYYYAELKGDTLFIAMEFCARRSLDTFITEQGELKDELIFKQFCRDILTGLAFLHSRGMAHGDIQPGNVLQDKYGQFKFVDYGDINRQMKAALSKVDLSYMSNTVPYMAPEVVINSKSFDPIPADIWSFGCLLIQLVTGFRPWHELEHDYAIVYRLGATKYLPEALLDLPLSPDGSEFVKSCLTHDPGERPTAADLLKCEYLTISTC